MRISDLGRRSGLSIPTIKFYIREGLLPPGTRTARNQARYGEAHVERLRVIRILRRDAGLGVRDIGRMLASIPDAGTDADAGPAEPADGQTGGLAGSPTNDRTSSASSGQPIGRTNGASVGVPRLGSAGESAGGSRAAPPDDASPRGEYSGMDSGVAGLTDVGGAAGVADVAGTVGGDDGAIERSAWAEVSRVARDMGWTIDEADPAGRDLVGAIVTIQRAWPFPVPPGQLLRYARAAKEIARFEVPDERDAAGGPERSPEFDILGVQLFEPLLLALRRIAYRDRAQQVREARARRAPPR